jgi:hypothetical protein
LHWKKVEALLKHLGAECYEGSSTVTFVLGGRKLMWIGHIPGESEAKDW